MLDDERYPIAIQPEGQVRYAEEKIATPVSSVSPVSALSAPNPGFRNTGRDSTVSSLGHGSVAPPYSLDTGIEDSKFSHRPAARRPWWRRPTVILLLILITLVAIILIGGIIFAISRSRSDRPNAVAQASVANSTRDSVASSGLFLKDETTWNMQIFSQAASGDITYHFSLDGSTFASRRNVSLAIPAKVGSPLSATASTDTTGVVYLSLFSLTLSNDIALAALACPAGISKCSTTSNNIISSQLSTPLSNYTGLAAVNIENAQDWRVFYHDQNMMVSQLAGNSSGFDEGVIIGGAALNRSSIAATNINATTSNLHVFYVDSLTQALHTMEFTSDWTIPVPVSSEVITQWNPFSGLSACYTETSDQIRTYFTGLDSKIYEFLGSKASTATTSWLAQPGNSPVWANADYVGAGITAVGWNDQARFFQASQKRLVQGSLNNLTWTEAFL